MVNNVTAILTTNWGVFTLFFLCLACFGASFGNFFLSLVYLELLGLFTCAMFTLNYLHCGDVGGQIFSLFYLVILASESLIMLTIYFCIVNLKNQR